MTTHDNQFYLVPHDVTGISGSGTLNLKGISGSELQQFSTELKAHKQLFIFDACNSGAVTDMLTSQNNGEEKAIAQLARNTGTFWLTASTAQQYAVEHSALGHGLFTYVLLEGLKGSANEGIRDDKITVTELSSYLVKWVPEISEKHMNTIQYPTIYGYGRDFPITRLK
jgi:uncharacterized caspase-like protein